MRTAFSKILSFVSKFWHTVVSMFCKRKTKVTVIIEEINNKEEENDDI